MTANNQPLLHQLTSDTSNTSVPRKPSTSVCSLRISHQVSNNVLQHPPVDCIYVNDNSSFATPIEAIYLPDIKCELDLDECEIPLSQNPFRNHDNGELQFIQPPTTPLSSVPGTERLQHPQETCQSTLHTSNTSLAAKPAFCARSTAQSHISTNSSSAFLSDLSLLQYLVKKYHIKDLTVRLSRLSDQVLDSLQQNGTVDCNFVDNQMLEQRNVRIKLEPVTVDACVCDDQVSDNLQQNLSSTVDDDDIEVSFEAIYDPVVKCEPEIVKSEAILDLSTIQFVAVTVKQEEMENAAADLDAQLDILELETSPETSNPSSNKDVNICASVFCCALCNFTTNRKSKISSHIVRQHVKGPNYKCRKYIKSFDHKEVLTAYISRVPPAKCCYKCPLCERGFKLEKRFNAHVKSHDKIFQCDVCGKILSRHQKLIDHKIIIHTKSSPLPCNMCGKIFYTEASLKQHTKAVHSSLSHKCDICDKSFKSKSHLRTHQREVKVSVRAFSCNQCEKTFASKCKLKQHSVVHSELRPFKCEPCNLCFNTSGHLRTHIRTVHSDVRPFKCHVCGKCYKMKDVLTQHLIRHTDVRNYKCEHCGKQFKTKDELERHLTSHSEIRPFACSQCHKNYKSKSGLIQHFRAALRNSRPFRCDKCSYACRSIHDLTVHQLVHSNVHSVN